MNITFRFQNHKNNWLVERAPTPTEVSQNTATLISQEWMFVYVEIMKIHINR